MPTIKLFITYFMEYKQTDETFSLIEVSCWKEIIRRKFEKVINKINQQRFFLLYTYSSEKHNSLLSENIGFKF